MIYSGRKLCKCPAVLCSDGHQLVLVLYALRREDGYGPITTWSWWLKWIRLAGKCVHL